MMDDRRPPSKYLDESGFSELWNYVYEDVDEDGRKFRYHQSDNEQTWFLWNRWCCAQASFVQTPEFDGWLVRCWAANRLSPFRNRAEELSVTSAQLAAKFICEFSDQRAALKD